MHSSIRFTFKMVIYGALILALTTFYAVDCVKAESYTISFDYANLNSGNTFYNRVSSISSVVYNGNTYYGIQSNFNSSANINRINFVLNNIPSKYNDKNIIFEGYIYNNRLTTSSINLNNLSCDIVNKAGTPVINGSTTYIPNNHVYHFTCKGVYNSSQPYLGVSLDNNNVNWSSGGMFTGFTNLKISFSDTQLLEDTKKDIEDTNDTLIDDDIDSDSTANAILLLENSLGLDTNFITSLIILPYNLLTTLYDNASVCSSINLGTLFDSELILPCIDIEYSIGSSLYNLIDIIMCGVCALGFVNSLKKLLNKILTLSSDIEETADIKIFK